MEGKQSTYFPLPITIALDADAIFMKNDVPEKSARWGTPPLGATRYRSGTELKRLDPSYHTTTKGPYEQKPSHCRIARQK